MNEQVQPGELSSNERRFLRCLLFGHKWMQPEGIFTKRFCARCGDVG